MEDNKPLHLALKLNRIAGHDIFNNTIGSKIISVLNIIQLGGMFMLGALEPILNFQSLDLLPDCFELIINHYLFIINMIWFRISIDSLKELISEKGFWRIDHMGEKLRNTQQTIYNFVNSAIKMMVVLGFLLLSSVFTLPLISKVRRLPMLCYQPVDFLQSPMYELVYLWQFLDCIIILFFVPSITGIFYASITFGYCQTMMLKEAIKNLDMETTNTPENEAECFRKMKLYIQYHHKLLEYANKVNQIFSFTSLNDFLVTMLNCVMSLYLIAVIGMSNTVLLGKCFLTIFANLWRLLLLCAALTLYSHQTQSVAEAVYGSQWIYNSSPRMRKAILLMIQRAQVGQEFVAGGIIKINMENYMAIIRLSFSFYTLMKSFQNGLEDA